MPDPTAVARILADFTPGAVGIWTGVVMFAGYLLREFRETRKLSAEDRLARREGYAKQVESLTAENRALRKDLSEFRIEHDEYWRFCHAETDQLRKHIVDLEDSVAGFKREQAQQRVSTARQYGKGVLDPPPDEEPKPP